MKQVNIEVTKNWYRLNECRQPVVILLGGTRSGKSYACIQYLIGKLLGEKNKNILFTRKTRPALKQSTYKVFISLLKKYGVYDEDSLNKTDLTYTYKTSSAVFTSIDDEAKIRSTEWSYVMMEEAPEFTYDDYIELKIRCSAPKQPDEVNQLIILANPVDVHGWINKELITKQGIQPIHSTYLDNPFLDKQYITELENLKNYDETYWKIYGLGEWAEAGEIIYQPFTMLDVLPPWDERIFGLDFGYNNPSALVEVRIKDNDIYLIERLYEAGLTNADLIERLKRMDIAPSDYIYCDSAEPDRIEELRRAGFWAVEAYKGKNSVKDGIDFIKRLKVYTLPTNVNLNEERAGYRWKKDKDNRVHDEPVKFEDHLMDAMRYGIYTHLAHRVAPAIYVL